MSMDVDREREGRPERESNLADHGLTKRYAQFVAAYIDQPPSERCPTTAYMKVYKSAMTQTAGQCYREARRILYVSQVQSAIISALDESEDQDSQAKRLCLGLARSSSSDKVRVDALKAYAGLSKALPAAPDNVPHDMESAAELLKAFKASVGD